MNVGHVPSDDYVVILEVLVCLRIHNQQPSLIGYCLDALDHLAVSLLSDVTVVHLDNAITFLESSCLGWGTRVHLADELAWFALFCMKIETVAREIGPYLEVA